MMNQLSFIRLIKLLAFAALIYVTSTTLVVACNTSIVLAEAEVITLDQAVNRIRKNRKAKVLGAETLHIDGQPVHVIKVLTKTGHVKKIRIRPNAKR
ncbi:MAG: hypothetical protein ABGX33_04930 [Cycloclasticus sp.]